MLRKPLIAGLLAAAAALPALAQNAPPPGPEGSAQEVARGYANPPMPNQAAINAGGRPGTAQLNNDVVDATDARAAATAQMNAAERAQYDRDRSAYMDALVRHDRAVNRTDRRYLVQQNAYAHAMYLWRMQVAACKRGHHRACNAPPPDPSRFY